MKKTGFLFIISSIIFFLFDRFTHVFSELLGKAICGDDYLRPVNGMMGDLACGFNTDMYVATCLVFLGVAGFLITVIDGLKKSQTTPRK